MSERGTIRSTWPGAWTCGPAVLEAEIWYPDFTLPPTEQPRVKIGVSHSRAVDGITIYFDGPRNGYVVLQHKTRHNPDGGLQEVIEPDCEVAFIPAWNEIK
jgi:hypothetical protein